MILGREAKKSKEDRLGVYQFLPIEHVATLRRNGFQAVAKFVVDLVYSIKRVPDIGRIRTVNGQRLMRILSLRTQVRKSFKRYTTYCLPKNLEGFSHDENGRNVIETAAQEKYAAKISKMEWE